jgi:hypothetical protein
MIHRPLHLQENALPQSYTPDFVLHELSNTQIIYIYYPFLLIFI